ncbi:MAG: DUF2851 family protein [Opitutae bacterium]|nr:DUF2851 family protein [Opitutae bacterium]
MPHPESCPAAVAEVQGFYGPFTFPELLLQKIWLRGDFDLTAARTTDGRALTILHAGRWNRLGGPDFRGARLRLGATEITGDVELHLYAEDWVAHRHAADPAYREVVLHVVLFPPTAGTVTRGADGREIPVLALLPLLHHDLEEYAADDAVERLANRPVARAIEELSPLPAAELTALLRDEAEKRWRWKTHFARLRIARLGWAGACHHTALEVLGYRFNRAAMLSVAARWPLAEWAAGRVEAETAFAAEAGRWSLQGVRPANHPRLRLRQYAEWARAVPDWPERLAAQAAAWPEVAREAGEGTRAVRRAGKFATWRRCWAAELTGGAVGGTRLDNLICDGWLPLLAAQRVRDGYGIWFHWPPGDLPPALVRALRDLGVCGGRAQPAAQGWAQGLQGWWLAREQAAGAPARTPSGRGA